jgi:hypothetical protein
MSGSSTLTWRLFMPDYAIDFQGSFARREPALKASNIAYQVTQGGTMLQLPRPLESYSQHEKDVIAFARNPFEGLAIFSGLDLPVAEEIVKALQQTYLVGGGDWNK